MQKLSYQNKFLEDQVRDLKENVEEAERQNETIKQELSCERTAHHETKSNWKLCKNHLEDDQNEQSVEISKVGFYVKFCLAFLLYSKCFTRSFRALCR